MSLSEINSINSLVDLAPTLLSLCNITIPNEWSGLDCSLEWKGKNKEIRKQALVEYVDEPQKLRLKTIITKKYKLTYYPGELYGELYDLVTNPEETINFYNDPAYKDIKQNLLMKLIDELESIETRAQRYSYA